MPARETFGWRARQSIERQGATKVSWRNEQIAKVSEQNAKVSEKVSEQSAKVSEQNAKVSEQNAKVSWSHAATHNTPVHIGNNHCGV